MPRQEQARAAAQRRQHEVRIAVQPRAHGDDPLEGLGALLDGLLVDWSARPLSPDSPTVLLVATVPEQAGSPAYARRVHTLVQRLLETGAFARVEADVPLPASEGSGEPEDALPGAVGAFSRGSTPPGSEAASWAREAVRCRQAWELPLPPGGRARGAGVLVGHPDTGYTLHPALGAAAVDRRRDRDVLTGDDDALDPLVPPDRSPWPVPSPGHGTKTGSVLAGRGDEVRGVVGVAPEAVLVPVRAVESVVQLFDSDVARAVDHARRVGCHVVSMSLGGKGFFGLREAVRRAVDSGMIVLAAAGNQVGVVVAPASYEECLAVAACGPGDLPWPGSSRGRAVDVTAPGWGVHVASFDWGSTPPRQVVSRSSGTSYAVAHVAGAAALWLAHHGLDRVRARYGGRTQAAFLHCVRAAARRPSGWNGDRYGAGVLDACALLQQPLPDPAALVPQLGAFAAVDDPLQRLSLLVDVDRHVLETALSRRLSSRGGALDRSLERFEGELAYLLAADADFRDELLLAAAPGAFDAGPLRVPAAASPDLERTLVDHGSTHVPAQA